MKEKCSYWDQTENKCSIIEDLTYNKLIVHFKNQHDICKWANNLGFYTGSKLTKGDLSIEKLSSWTIMTQREPISSIKQL